jgi:acyl carrier protein
MAHHILPVKPYKLVAVYFKSFNVNLLSKTRRINLQVVVVVLHFLLNQNLRGKIMSKEDIQAKINAIIVEQLGVEDPAKIVPEASIIDDLGADSLDTVELIMAIEEELGMDIPDDAATKLTTVGEVYAFVEENLPKAD